MRVTFLGTSDAVPTPEKNHTAVLLSYKSENLLIDCGEGTQRQFSRAKISPSKVTRLLITHWHGDHVLGIPGFLQTLGFSGHTNKLRIYGPKGTKEFFKNLMKSFQSFFVSNLDLEINEIKSGKIIDEEDFSVYAQELKHHNGVGYKFIEKDRRRIKLAYIKKKGLSPGPILKKLQQGKDITFEGEKIKCEDATTLVKGRIVSFIFDTGYCDNAFSLAKDSDLAIIESTYLDKDKKFAEERNHLTAKQAATIAKDSNVVELYLTHISRRYSAKNKEVLNEAKKIFKNSFLAKDLMSVTL